MEKNTHTNDIITVHVIDQGRRQAVSALPGTPPCAQKGWGQAHREVVQRYFPGSSACAILKKLSDTRESYRGTSVAET